MKVITLLSIIVFCSATALAEVVLIVDGFDSEGKFQLVEISLPDSGENYKYKVVPNIRPKKLPGQFHFYDFVDKYSICNIYPVIDADLDIRKTPKGYTVIELQPNYGPTTLKECIDEEDGYVIFNTQDGSSPLGGVQPLSLTMGAGRSAIFLVPADAKISYQIGLGNEAIDGEIK